MDVAEPVNLRCSAVLLRADQLLLLRRDRDGLTDWVLPGGSPRRGESLASCVRREVAEETGLHVTADRVAFVLEASNPAEELHLLDLVFTVSDTDRSAAPRELEPGLAPVFYPVEGLAGLSLRPPIAGHLRGLHARGGDARGAYLGNVWRPADLLTPTDEVDPAVRP
jgi:ADP-ribose pyrophosphatase YjhB (NUDIX family)